jgi:hypothetical protein
MFGSLKARDGYNFLLLSLVRVLMATHISLRVFHVPGSHNTVADTLSRSMFEVASTLSLGMHVRLFQPPWDALGVAEL